MSSHFMAKRIMLPFDVAICPLAVLAEDAVILGAASDYSSSDSLYASTPSSPVAHSITQALDFSILERTVRLYVTFIKFSDAYVICTDSI